MMADAFNPDPLVTKALDLVQIRRAKLADDGSAGSFQTFAFAGGLLVLGGGFDPGGAGRWKALARVPDGCDRLETAPGVTVKRLRTSLRVRSKEVATKPKVLAEGLRDMTPDALADILERLAPPIVQVSVRGVESPRRGITPLSARVTSRRWEMM